MATAPFTLTTTVPGDTDIVSQFPGVDRGHLSVINSWIKTDHNLNGTHNYATFLQVGTADSSGATASAPTPAASNTAIYRDTDGALKAKNGDDSSVAFLGGVAPSAVVFYATATLPTGWLWCDGSAVSRSTYARLFTAIGTTYGPGDGSTTFTLPDINSRLIVGKDRTGSGRVTTAGSSVDGTTLASVGGGQNVTLLTANLPPYTPAGTINNVVSGGTTGGTASSNVSQQDVHPYPANPSSIVVTSTFIGTAQGGTSTPVVTMPPVIVLNPAIKY